MRKAAPFALLFILAGCGDTYTPGPLYQATSPDCSTPVDADTFELPRGVTVAATTVLPQPAEGGIEIGVNYMLPRTTQVKFATAHFQVSQPKGALIENATVLSVYQRPTNARAEMVEIVNGVPLALFSVGTSDDTQFRYRLIIKGKLPQRFDLTPPDVIIGGKRYVSRTFTYRWFEDKQAFGMCH
ncbi:hypothetical protein [Pseudoduganella violaceinigra]|uniref:hypothetical protein n=1 Tax=Pseudoduganella violaceinigra TaxID=246602 RepID=UPI0003F725B5|nr:hypothetical protein [Pseudoduganella violaceinigra]